VVALVCDPSYSRGRGRRIVVREWTLEKNMRPYLKNKSETKKDGAWLK
jgi:hypothetical protein